MGLDSEQAQGEHEITRRKYEQSGGACHIGWWTMGAADQKPVRATAIK